MANIINYYLKLLETPHAKKSWNDLGEYYATNGLKEEAAGFAYLLAEFFTNDTSNSTYPEPQQRENNPQGDIIVATAQCQDNSG